MTTYEEVKQALEKVPQFRERSKRGHFIFIMSLRALGIIDSKPVSSGDTITIKIGDTKSGSPTNELLTTMSNYDRAWRDVLSDDGNKHLRGSDYDSKNILEQKKQIELGYIPTFEESSKAFGL